ncbi:MAG TPA: PD-(D/E)XK nuclease family protein, partial [Patescibacteria group bacterium]
VERTFKFAHDRVLVRGRLDYVEDNNGKVTILDFKTTEGVDGKKAITRVKSSIQLKIYALAYEKLYGRRPDEIGIYFLENGLVSTIPVTQKVMDEAILAIKVAEAGIRDHNFKANPKEGAFTCQYCSFNRICPESLV